MFDLCRIDFLIFENSMIACKKLVLLFFTFTFYLVWVISPKSHLPSVSADCIGVEIKYTNNGNVAFCFLASRIQQHVDYIVMSILTNRNGCTSNLEKEKKENGG